MAACAADLMKHINSLTLRQDIPNFRVGDTVRVSVKIVEGNKERIQAFEGAVIKRSGGSGSGATFTVRKVSFNIGVERTFFLHSPRLEKITVIGRGKARRARLFYLRPLRGKASAIKRRDSKDPFETQNENLSDAALSDTKISETKSQELSQAAV